MFDDNAAAKAAFDADQVDGIVFDLPTAYFITAVEIEGSSIVGVLPAQGEAEELGFLFENGSPLVPCVNEALATLQGRRHARRAARSLAEPGRRHPDPGVLTAR